MKKTIKHLRHRNGNFYGVIGENTGYGYLHVGDVVAYLNEDKNIVKGFIAKRVSDGRYGVMGKMSTPFAEMKKLTKVLSFDNVKSSAYNKLSSSGEFYVDEIEVKQMTIAEIEAKLGYPIEIVQ